MQNSSTHLASNRGLAAKDTRVIIAVSMLFPALIALPLFAPTIGYYFPAFVPERLPGVAAHLAVTGAPLLACVMLDRARCVSISAALQITVLLFVCSNATAIIADMLYPPVVDLGHLLIFALYSTFAAAGVARGARRAGAKPGVATSVFIAGCALPPLLMFESSSIAHNPVVLLEGLSPSWAWHAGAAAPWELVILGVTGWCVALWREGCIRMRARRFRRRQ